MKAVIFILIFILSSVGTAKLKGKVKDNKEKKYMGEIENPPGGAKVDQYLYNQWRNMIEPQKFPMLPHSDKLTADDKKLAPIETRQRYIVHLDTSHVDLKNEIYDEGYYYFAYSTKEQGDLLVVVHPKYRKCFDDLKKKFDYVQAEVFEYGELAGRKQIVLEYPRQCVGTLKYTGSKLPTALSDL